MSGRLCKCGADLRIQSVKTDMGLVSLGLCIECDRAKCRACRKAAGPFFSTARDRCEHCGRVL